MTPLTHSTVCTAGLLPSDDGPDPSSNFECSICLELSQDPVVTMCGHLFCWSCLHQWITLHSIVQECPVCKALVKDKIIPLYGRGSITDSKTKAAHEFGAPRPPPAQQNYAAGATVPSSPRFRHRSIVSHENYVSRGGSIVSHENYVSRGGQSMYSAAPSGLFPALFGLHMISSPDHSSRFSSGSSNNASFRLPAIGHNITAQQQRLNARQESVLYWFLILLACFAILCLLLF